MKPKQILLVGGMVFFVIAVLSLGGMFDPWELKAYNQLFLGRGAQPPSDQIVIVAIDDESIGWLGNWPWSRNVHAQLLQILEAAGAKLVAFDILFDSPSSLRDRGDEAMSSAVEQARIPVIFASMQTVDPYGVQSNHLPLPGYRKAQNYGFADPVVDPDGFVRSVRLLKPYQGQLIESFTLRILRELEGKAQKDIQLTNAGITLGKYRVPMDPEGRLLINFAGSAGAQKTIPFDRVLDKSILKRHPDTFKDKIVLVGASAIILQDVFYTPFFNYQNKKVRMPGVEIRASELDTILQNKYIRQPSKWMELLFLLVFILGNSFLFFRLRIVSALMLAVAELLALGFFALLSFSYLRFWLGNLVSLLLSILAMYFVAVIIRFLQEEKEKRRIRGIFSRYVAPNVVNELLKNKDSLKLGGEKKEITVFFSDIRSFTTFSESHTPEEVVAQLNEYLSAMTKVIFDFGGTLDKYVGDEIMAVWGAPLAQPNHAEIGVRCALEQLRVLRELQAKWRSEGKQPLDIGMGLNTGQMVVGNIGSPAHMDYTVIGDAVNLGARLEAETRKHGTPEAPCHIIISEFTYEQIKDKGIPTRLMGDVTVKGKNKSVQIYEVLAD